MSYVPTPAQAPTPQASGSHSGMKVLTIIGACLAVLFLILSVGLGLGARSTHQAARQAQSDAQALRDQAKETETETATTRTKINDATNKKEAQAWCDSLTSANADFTSLDVKAREYSSLTATRHEAIGKICPKKRTLSRRTQKTHRRTWSSKTPPPARRGHPRRQSPDPYPLPERTWRASRRTTSASRSTSSPALPSRAISPQTSRRSPSPRADQPR